MQRPHSLLWQDLTREEIADARNEGALVAIPVGAIEQHGSHLPVNTDSLISASVTALAAHRTKTITVLIAPLLPYGFSPHHLSHTGTISLRLQTYLAVLHDMAKSLADSGFRRIAFVNGHGGNSAPLRALATELVTDGILVAAVDYWAPARAEWSGLLRGALKQFGHACEFETALVLALKRDDGTAVENVMRRAKDLPPRTIQPWIPAGHTHDPITEAGAAWPPLFHADDVGYYGDPAQATVENGAAILDTVATQLARFFENFAATPLRFGVARECGAPLISEPLISEALPAL
jgi:creatinine amidohydrolase